MPNTRQPIIVIDDEEDMRASISQWMDLTGFEPHSYENGAQAIKEIDSDFPGVVISDIRMPVMDGTEVLKHLQALDKTLPVIMITGHGDVPLAVECMRAGAYDFVEKPFDPERLADLVKRAAEARQLAVDNRKLRAELTDGSVLMRRLIGTSAPMEKFRQDIRTIAGSESAVAIRGEPGSGRNLAARAVHAMSGRGAQPLHHVNCAALSPLELEMMLFGHPSQSDKVPLLSDATSGSVILDHIESLPLILQRRMEDTLQKAGNRLPRLMTLFDTSGPSEAEIIPELMLRLTTLRLEVPALRDCGNDILDIFEFYLAQFARENDLPPRDISPEEADLLLNFKWDGNIRQLINIAERYSLQPVGQARSLMDVMPGAEAPSETPDPSSATLKEQVETFERLRIRKSLTRHKGVISHVMVELNLPRRTLNEKMAKYGLHRSDYT